MEQRNGTQVDLRLRCVGIDRALRDVRLQVKLRKLGSQFLPARLDYSPFWRRGKEITVSVVLDRFEAPLEGPLA